MSKQRQQHSAEFKAKVALEALKELKTVPELAREYTVPPPPSNQWKQPRRENAPHLGGRAGRAPEGTDPAIVTARDEKLGRLHMELDGLKKKLTGSVDERRALMEPTHPDLRIERQCDLLGLARSRHDYHPATTQPDALHLMR